MKKEMPVFEDCEKPHKHCHNQADCYQRWRWGRCPHDPYIEEKKK